MAGAPPPKDRLSAGATARSEALDLDLEPRYLGDETRSLGPALALTEQWERSADAPRRLGAAGAVRPRAGW